jgi:hypothetical protein
MAGTDFISRRFVRHVLRALCVVALLAGSIAARASEYHGLVTFNGLPVPGATVTVTQGGKKLVTVTDTQGFYSFPTLTDGAVTIDVEMTGFAAIRQNVTIAPDLAMGKWELKQLSLEQIRTALKPVPSAGVTVTQARSEPKKTGEAPKPQGAQTAAPAPPPEEVAQRAADGLLINGSVNNAATSQFTLGPRFGNTASGKSLYTFSVYVSIDNSALNAKSYSLTGVDTPKPELNQLSGGFSVQGPLKIPHLLRNGPNIFANYAWVRNGTAVTTPGFVPTQAQRDGNFLLPIYAPTFGLSAACLSAGVTPGAQFAGNVIPVACISPSAQSLLKLYPLPNFNGNSQYNYQLPLVTNLDSDAVSAIVNKTVGRKDQLSGTFGLTSTRGNNTNLLGFLDATNNLGIVSHINWSHSFTGRLRMNLGYQFSRLSQLMTPYFANRMNVSGNAGITGNNQDPENWGPPALNFSSNLTPMTDANSFFNRNETNGVSSRMTWTHSSHNFTVGFDFRRQEFNYLAQTNPRGTFTFTGATTAGSVAGSGSDVADFLLGIPATSTIAFGNADKYLRQSVYDAYLNDDWRVNPQLTINAGVRWEYGSPVTETENRLVNLDVATGFSKVAPVVASDPVGPVTLQSYPRSLMQPDKNGIEPKIGLSWRPIPGSSMVIGAGYGIYYDTSIYQGIAIQMAQQAPLSKSLTVQNSPTCLLTLANGFNPCSATTPQTFGVDPNYRVGYVQTWNLTARRDLPGSLQMTAAYLGNKGTHGAQQFLPNTYPAGGNNPCLSCPVGFQYLASGGNSTRQAGQLQLRRRLHNGFTASVLYTFSKSIDDDTSLGGPGATTQSSTGTQSSAGPAQDGQSAATQSTGGLVQDWLNLSGQRGLSTFDQRHLLNVTVQYTTGMGMGGGTLMSGWKGRVYKEWTFLTQISAGSGLPQTPFASAVAVSGSSGFVRPNVTGLPLYAAPPGRFLNPAAYITPPAGQWGNARRDAITGPKQFSLDAYMVRTFRLNPRFNLTVQVTATNALNHVTYTSWWTNINSTQFGLPQTANGMRTLQTTFRLRF